MLIGGRSLFAAKEERCEQAFLNENLAIGPPYCLHPSDCQQKRRDTSGEILTGLFQKQVV
jgi:hypothetical protein